MARESHLNKEFMYSHMYGYIYFLFYIFFIKGSWWRDWNCIRSCIRNWLSVRVNNIRQKHNSSIIFHYICLMYKNLTGILMQLQPIWMRKQLDECWNVGSIRVKWSAKRYLSQQNCHQSVSAIIHQFIQYAEISFELSQAIGRVRLRNIRNNLWPICSCHT